MAKGKRVVLRVRYKRGGWALGADGWFWLKSDAIHFGALRCRDVLLGGGLAQLVVHGKNGRIQFERTYGRDPRRFKG